MKLNKKWTLKSDLLKSEIIDLVQFSSLSMEIGVKKNDLVKISKDYLDIYLVTKYLMSPNNKNLDYKEFEKFKDIKIDDEPQNNDKNERQILLEALNDLINLELKEEHNLNINNILNVFKITIKSNYKMMEKTFSKLNNDPELKKTKDNFLNSIFEYVKSSYEYLEKTKDKKLEKTKSSGLELN